MLLLVDIYVQTHFAILVHGEMQEIILKFLSRLLVTWTRSIDVSFNSEMLYFERRINIDIPCWNGTLVYS